MKVLVLGGDGLLGHHLLGVLAPLHETRVTLRRPLGDYAPLGCFSAKNARGGIDVRDPAALGATLAEFRPEAVVNAVAVVPQRADAGDVEVNLAVNAFFPHRLAAMCREIGARLVHVSTDGVFSGGRGNYGEADRPDPADLYGRSKLIGEVAGEGVLVLRTALVGPGLAGGKVGPGNGLIDWFLQQQGRVKGYRGAIFSGLTAKELARVIERLVGRHLGASGLYHVGGAHISKHDLLAGLEKRLKRGVQVVPDDAVSVDRSLDSTRFRGEFAYAPPTWDAMLEEMAHDISERAR